MYKGTTLKFSDTVSGEVYTDDLHQVIYATDASAYREKPALIVLPKNSSDIHKTIEYARINNLSIIPRTAGTSLAGQVVGSGIIVDCSKYLTRILEVNTKEKWVRVEPGVVLDELNLHLKDYGLFFGPETSTSNRCMIGGMVGNNSCGAHSLIYGSTREHTLEVKAILSDGTEVEFKKTSLSEFKNKLTKEGLEGDLYRHINKTLSDKTVRAEIEKEFPDADIERRNTGYAVDILGAMKPFSSNGSDFNFCSLICGSEGTLAFITEIKLNLVELPTSHKGLLVVHHKTIAEAIDANVTALEHNPVAIELIDKFLLDCTLNSREHRKNRFFLDGDPGALLCIEIYGETDEEVTQKADDIIKDFKSRNFGFSYPLLFGNDISRVWALRKAGLGLLSNIPGDKKPQPVIEDTSVSPKKLGAYIEEFNKVLEENNVECVYYAHIATGELHLRPVLSLKEKEGVRLFRVLATEIARLVKKYGGSLSGEHGDGRLRGEFISYMIGEKNYALLKDLKSTWDPEGIFNKGKITDTPPMDTFLRFDTEVETPEISTAYDFSDTLGLVRMAEKCNGTADCRKSSIIGGTMCPSFQATKDEKSTTRARANMLREIINKNTKSNKFDSKELYETLDLCLSCKGCKTECPSGVDMAKLKSEFLHQYYKTNRRPIRMYLIATFSLSQKVASYFAGVYNFVVRNTLLSSWLKKAIGFATDRSIPLVNRVTWRLWLKKNLKNLNKVGDVTGEVVLFIDEFTNYNEAHIGIIAVKLLSKLGYKITYIKHSESGRARFSKGLLKSAKKIAERNVQVFENKTNSKIPIVGIEPSAILSFRDEYPDLLRGEMKKRAETLSKRTFTIEEFIADEFKAGRISREQFNTDFQTILYHGHCQQKALVGTEPAKIVLSIPENYTVEEIKSGCCGMAGSFGYEKEHFDLANKIGELVLFPKVRSSESEIISASGTSCRHHIKDGTGKSSLHPVEILWSAILNR